MYDNLVKQLRTECILPYATLQLMRKSADAIEELSKKRDTACWGCKCSKIERNEWIPVTERLPEDYEQVLTCDERGNIHMFSHNRLFKYPFGIKPENQRYFMPKWWMPLPEPPKEET